MRVKVGVPKVASLSVFFPAYNDAPSLPPLLRDTFAVLEECVSDYEVIVIDDGSRDKTAEVLEQLGREYGPVLLSWEEPGHERVAPHAERSPLPGEVLAQVVHGRLGHRVCKHLGEGNQTSHAPHVDNAGALATGRGPIHEVTAELLAAPHHRQLVDADDPLDLVVGDVEEGSGGVGGRAIHEDVNPPTPSVHSVNEFADLGAPGEVALFETCLTNPPNALSDGVAPVGVTSDHYHPGAGSGQGFGHHAAQHAGAADDDRHLPINPEGLHDLHQPILRPLGCL